MVNQSPSSQFSSHNFFSIKIDHNYALSTSEHKPKLKTINTQSLQTFEKIFFQMSDRTKYSFMWQVVQFHPDWQKISQESKQEIKHCQQIWHQIVLDSFELTHEKQFTINWKPLAVQILIYVVNYFNPYEETNPKEYWLKVARKMQTMTRYHLTDQQCQANWNNLLKHNYYIHYHKNALLFSIMTAKFKDPNLDFCLIRIPLNNWPEQRKYAFIRLVLIHQSNWNAIAQNWPITWSSAICQSIWNFALNSAISNISEESCWPSILYDILYSAVQTLTHQSSDSKVFWIETSARINTVTGLTMAPSIYESKWRDWLITQKNPQQFIITENTIQQVNKEKDYISFEELLADNPPTPISLEEFLGISTCEESSLLSADFNDTNFYEEPPKEIKQIDFDIENFISHVLSESPTEC